MKKMQNMRLVKLLINATFALDGDGLGLVPAGNIVGVRNAAGTPLDTAATVRDVAPAVLFGVLLLVHLVLDVGEVTATLNIRRGVEEGDPPVGIGDLLLARHEDRQELSETEPRPSDLITVAPNGQMIPYVANGNS